MMHFPRLSKHMATREPALLHRCTGKRRETNDVSGRINVVHAGLKVLIDHQFAAAIRVESCGSEIQQIAIGLATDGVKKPLSVNVLSALQFGKDSIPCWIVSYRYHFLTKAENCSQLA